LLAWLTIALVLKLLVDAIGAMLVWYFEHGVKGRIHGFADAGFFATLRDWQALG